MTNRSLGFLSTAAALISLFGGLHLQIASGRALDRFVPDDASLRTATTVAALAVNRDAKSDRGDISSNSEEGRTIVFQHPSLQSTTVALHLWETVNAVKKAPAPKHGKPAVDKNRPAIACESAVSVLTEVAKQVEVGRCVT
jgi:hypothetical protein